MVRTVHCINLVFVMLVAGYLATLRLPACAQTLSVPSSGVNATLSATHTSNTYTVNAPVDGDVTFTINTDANLSVLVQFFDIDDKNRINSIYCSYNGLASLTIPHLGPGATYYLSVSVNGGAGSYTLSDNESTPPYAKNPAQGIALTVGQTATGHVGYSTTSYYTQNNIDQYQYTVPVDGDVTFTLKTDNTLDALLRFRDTNGNQISYVYCNPGYSATLTIPHLGPIPASAHGTTYFVSVEVNSGYGSYQLQSSEVQPPYAKNTEPNDNPYDAILMGVGKKVTGHVGYSTTSYSAQDNIDFYKIKPNADGDMKFTLTTDDTLDGLLRFWDSDGSSQIGYVYCTPGLRASLTIPHLGPGATYFVSIEVNSGYGSYELVNSLQKPKEKPAKEPNNSAAQALPFALGTSVQGLIGYSTTSYNATDNIDFYKVTVTAAGTLTINVKTELTLYGLVRLWNTDGTSQLGYVYCGYGLSRSLSYALPAIGTYYVSIECNGGYGGYTLSNTFH